MMLGSAGRSRVDQALDAMLKDAQRGKFDVVMAWAIDRIGRSLVHLLNTIEGLKACGVDLYLDQQSIDTTTPSGKLMLQMTGAFAEFERAMIQARIHAGLARAKANGKRLGVAFEQCGGGRQGAPSLAQGMGINRVAKQVGLSNGTVARLKAENERLHSSNLWLDQQVTKLREQRDQAQSELIAGKG